MVTQAEIARRSEVVIVPSDALVTVKYLLSKFPDLEPKQDGTMGVLEGISVLNNVACIVRIEVSRYNIGEIRFIFLSHTRREKWRIMEDHSSVLINQDSIEIDRTILNRPAQESIFIRGTLGAKLVFKNNNFVGKPDIFTGFGFRRTSDIDMEKSRCWSGDLSGKIPGYYIEFRTVIDKISEVVIAQEMTSSRAHKPSTPVSLSDNFII